MRLFLLGLFYLGFFFVPLYFLNYLVFNVLDITNPTLITFSSVLISLYLAYNNPLYHDIQPSVLSSVFLTIVTAILTVINFKVGIDATNDSYLYHLNIVFPIHFHHHLLEPQFFDLDSYSQGYPKYTEFLQSLSVSLTHNFWGYGLASILVIPASYVVTFFISKKLGFTSTQADLIALTYSINPVNITQATTSYVDSTQSLYLLSSILFLLNIKTTFSLVVFLISIVALLNIKFTGITLSFILLTFAFIWHFNLFKKHWLKYSSLGFVILLIASAHYINNFINFNTFVYPFIDFDMARQIANLYVPEQTKLEKLITLFWVTPNTTWYALLQGTWSFLWYPMPFLLLLALIQAIYQRNTLFWLLTLLLCTCLLLDPVLSMGRYVSYFQFIGFAAFVYVFRAYRLIWMMPVAYFALSLYIIANPYTSMITSRLNQYQQYQIFFDTILSAKARGFQYFYHINSGCSGYYWYLRYYQHDVQLVASKPQGDNFFYIDSDPDAEQCRIRAFYKVKPNFSVQAKNDALFFAPHIDNPSALKHCKACITDYGCMYIPMQIYNSPFDITRIMPNAQQATTMSVECEAIEGQIFHIEKPIHAK